MTRVFELAREDKTRQIRVDGEIICSWGVLFSRKKSIRDFGGF